MEGHCLEGYCRFVPDMELESSSKEEEVGERQSRSRPKQQATAPVKQKV